MLLKLKSKEGETTCKNTSSYVEMSWDKDTFEKTIDYYYGEYRKGVFGKKCKVKLYIFSSHIECLGYPIILNELANETEEHSIDYLKIRNVYEDTVSNHPGIVIEYIEDSVVTNKSTSKIALLGITEPTKWTKLLLNTRDEIIEKNKQAELAKYENEKKEQELRIAYEAESAQFYLDCYNFHVKSSTPVYELYKDKNKIALIYIDENRSLNFLKIDGENKEESTGIIPFDKIHYYEKAGDIHYVSEIHGDYSSYGGSITGGNFSKLAAVGGGLLFGMLGMTAGALLSYKPTQTEGTKTDFTINSDTKQIDSRSVILNFYSDIKKQYIDIELPKDIYNFLQTYLPEKKYNIVLELEKKTVIHHAIPQIESGKPLSSPFEKVSGIEAKQNISSTADFKQKVEKLKIMKDAGLLTDEEFNLEKAKLLETL